ncbi:MAG: response regulator transcription factor [Bacteroidales bacterium]|jgi:DNA-binding LytR/AlgR family response regulator|nr:response regulator transcription factor [Bacteroidales bacterium]
MIRYIVVDDEPLARGVVKRFAAEIPELTMLSEFNNATEAIEYIDNNCVDLIFLDINMPEVSGINMLKSLPNPPKVIFTTAYPEFAVDGFELNAVDYLVKPFSFERFSKAISKVPETCDNSTEQDNYIFIKVDKKLIKVDKDSICHIQAVGDYIKIFTPDSAYITYSTLKSFKERLNSGFIQVHKSYLVAIKHIDYIEGNRLFVNNTEIPIGQSFKKDVIGLFE